MQPPQINVSFEDLPKEPQQRHEVLVDVFGEYLLWTLSQTMMRIRHLLESEDERDKMGKLFRGVFDEVSALPIDHQELAQKLAERAVSDFAKLFLTMVSGEGFDDALGPKHVFRFRLDMEVCDAKRGNVVLVETINRDGEKFFPEYWGRWLNRYRR